MHEQRSSNDPESGSTQSAPSRALKAAEAGRYLADRLGRDHPFDEQAMWRFARRGDIDVVRIRRDVYFRTDLLDRFVSQGGTRRDP